MCDLFVVFSVLSTQHIHAHDLSLFFAFTSLSLSLPVQAVTESVLSLDTHITGVSEVQVTNCSNYSILTFNYSVLTFNFFLCFISLMFLWLVRVLIVCCTASLCVSRTPVFTHCTYTSTILPLHLIIFIQFFTLFYFVFIFFIYFFIFSFSFLLCTYRCTTEMTGS